MSETIVVWVVKPHANSSEYDEWWGDAETELDHHYAFAYAEARLHDMWDSNEIDAPPRPVSIERRTVRKDEWPDEQ